LIEAAQVLRAIASKVLSGGGRVHETIRGRSLPLVVFLPSDNATVLRWRSTASHRESAASHLLQEHSHAESLTGATGRDVTTERQSIDNHLRRTGRRPR